MRCEQHDLAAGPDGLCVVCRRERGVVPTPPSSSASTANVVVIGGVGGLLLVVVAAGMGYRAVRDRQIVAEAERMTSRSLPTLPAPLTSSAPPAPPASVGTAASTGGGTPALVAAQARALSDVRIVVYTTQWCPVCKRAKTWLQTNNIAYEERDVEVSKAWSNELRERNPAGSIPTFDVEGQVSIGLRPNELLAMRERAAARKVAQ